MKNGTGPAPGRPPPHKPGPIMRSFGELADLKGASLPSRMSGATIEIVYNGHVDPQTLHCFQSVRRNTNLTTASTSAIDPSVCEDARRYGHHCFSLGTSVGSRPVSDNLREDLQSLLQRINPGLKLRGQSPGIISLPAQSPITLEAPPEYGLKGGAARQALMQSLGIQTGATLRDVDLIRIGSPRRTALDDTLSRLYMADDYRFNPRHGVEAVPDSRRFVFEREITLNELYWSRGRVYASLQCIFDTLGGVIRPSYSELRGHGDGIRGIVAAKMVRFFAQSTTTAHEALLEKFILSQQAPVKPFHIALNLKRAQAHGDNTAQFYTALCADLKLSPVLPFAEGPDAVIAALIKSRAVGDGFFHHAGADEC